VRLLRDRERRELARLATDWPKLIPLLRALLWSQAEDADIADRLLVLRKFVPELAQLIAGDRLSCAIGLVELGRSVSVRHLRPLVEFLAHPHPACAASKRGLCSRRAACGFGALARVAHPAPTPLSVAVEIKGRVQPDLALPSGRSKPRPALTRVRTAA
jgi:hypothetical protein